MKVLHTLAAFNRGIVSRLALARVMDVKRVALSAEIQKNWMSRVMGSMMLRPGLGYLGSTRNDSAAKHLEFIFATSDTALIELTDSVMRVRIDDVIVRRPAVTSKFDRWNGASWSTSSDTTSGFGDATDVGYWKDNDQAGATSDLHTTAGYLSLIGTGTNSAIRDRRVTVVETGVEHAVNFVIARGSVALRIGTSEGAEDLFSEHTLRAGYHSIAITPSAPFYIRISNNRDIAALVDSVTLSQAAADMELTTPWTASDLPYVRNDQSGDVIFVACKGRPQKRIERQGADSPRSWSVVEYAPEDGPLGDLNTGPVRLKGSALSGDITVESDQLFFKTTHVGALFAMTSAGQAVSRRLQSDNVFTDPIRVVGVGASRAFTLELTGPTFSGTTTVTLQRSPATPGDWSDVASYTATTTTSLNDGLDNQIMYFRLGIKTGNYTASDDITATLTFSAGSITGIVRVTEFGSGTSVSAQVLVALGKADEFTEDWREGDWSPRKGYPTAVAFDDGRLFWAGKGLEWGSVPDQFDSFDDTIEGDSAPIRRTLGQGPIDVVNWLASGANLMFGMEGNVSVARSSALDEPLTQTKFRLTPIGDTGTAPIPAKRVDTSFVYVGRNKRQVFELGFDGANYSPPANLTAVCPEIGNPGFVRIGFQFYPDRRIHFVRQDGTVVVLVLDKLENVNAWLEIVTDGVIEDVVVLPGAPGTEEEDRVYYTVQRTIDGSTKRYLEKWATEAQAQGASDSRIADSHVTYTGAYDTLSGLDHVEGEEVVLWRDGICPEDPSTGDPKTFTVSGGAITPDEPVVAFACVGLPYEGPWKSSKLAVASQMESPLTQRKQVQTLGLVLADAHPKGLKYGQKLTGVDADVQMDDLPLVEAGVEVDVNAVAQGRDYEAFTVPGEWSTDARLCLLAKAPRPCTILAAVIGVEGNDKA